MGHWFDEEMWENSSVSLLLPTPCPTLWKKIKSKVWIYANDNCVIHITDNSFIEPPSQTPDKSNYEGVCHKVQKSKSQPSFFNLHYHGMKKLVKLIFIFLWKICLLNNHSWWEGELEFSMYFHKKTRENTFPRSLM